MPTKAAKYYTMGAWNFAINGNDTFQDVYQLFFQFYNEGQDPVIISKQLWELFEAEINDIDCRNNTLFALAQAQWETKSLDSKIYLEVKHIIETGNDIKVWEGLGADEKILNTRKIVLQTFLAKISTEKQKPKRRTKQRDDYFSNQLLKISSPDDKRTLTLTESGTDENNCSTQILIDFEGGGAGVYAAKGINLSIKTFWKDNQTIVVETKKTYLVLQKWEQVQDYQDIIRVEYIEI